MGEAPLLPDLSKIEWACAEYHYCYLQATGSWSKKRALAKIGLLHVWSCESKYPADPAPYSRLRDGGGLQILSGFAMGRDVKLVQSVVVVTVKETCLKETA